jgi:hypothetical protein
VHSFPRSHFLSYLKYGIVENTEQERKMTKTVLVAHRNWNLVNIAYLDKSVTTKIWHFLFIGTRKERNICRFTFNRYSAITQLVELAAGEQLCRRCTHTKV